MRLVVLSVVLVMVGAGGAWAGTALTCDEFKIRLNQSIEMFGHRVAYPDPFKLGYDGGETGARFDWDGIVGLSGTMHCSQAGEFDDFSIAVNDDFLQPPKLEIGTARFLELAAASVCSLAKSTPAACREVLTSMLAGAVHEFEVETTRGEKIPGGTRDFTITQNTDAELDVTPATISWSIGPGQGNTINAEREPLALKDRAED